MCDLVECWTDYETYCLYQQRLAEEQENQRRSMEQYLSQKSEWEAYVKSRLSAPKTLFGKIIVWLQLNW